MASVCQFLFTKFKRTSVLNTLFKIFRKDSVSVKQLLKLWILNKIFILCNFEGPYNNYWIMAFFWKRLLHPKLWSSAKHLRTRKIFGSVWLVHTVRFVQPIKCKPFSVCGILHARSSNRKSFRLYPDRLW